MKKYLVYLLCALLLALPGLPSGAKLLASPPIERRAEKVFICVSRTAYAYHGTTHCRGLQRCTHQIKSVTIAKAKDMGYKACKICY
jgi:hypothetical protein